MIDGNWLESPEERARRKRPLTIHEDAVAIDKRMERRLKRLHRDTVRFEWKPHLEHRGESVLWLENQEVGTFEWSHPKGRTALASVLGAEVSCRRGVVNWTAVLVRSAGFDGHELESRMRGVRGRVLRWNGEPLFRTFVGGFSKWFWIGDMDSRGLISFETRPGTTRDLDGVEMRVAKRMMSREETPFL
ncbi:MAG: hypothetical protein R3253_09300, partial [Longimicrobiales bacterium]|nr:hypothetical protein [Longimicrobiales bacterium]